MNRKLQLPLGPADVSSGPYRIVSRAHEDQIVFLVKR
jgi:hypothetical protein